MRKGNILRGIALAAAVGGLSGCFRYVPTELQVTPEGESVRLVVTRAGAVELAEVADLDGPIPVIRGEVAGEEGGDLLLRVPIVQRQVGFHTAQLAQTVRVPTGEILSVERRTFDPVGTGLFIGGGLAVAGAVIFLIMESFGEGGIDGGDDAPEETRIPVKLFSLPFGH